MTHRNITVLVVDDSRVAQLLLRHILEADPQVQVIGVADNGQGALDFLRAHTPDVVLMDIQMPGMDGLETARRIMESQPLPIVICSATGNAEQVATTFRAIEAGALACVEKPVGREHPGFDEMAARLRETVKVMSEVKVVRRWTRARIAATPTPRPRPVAVARARADVAVVGIGASTGGPQVLHEILAGLPKAFPAPILVVQHIAPGFLPGFADWLNQATGRPVHIAMPGVYPARGHVYLAPDDFHMGLSAGGGILLSKDEPQNHLRPAISYLFQSLADVCGAAAVGVLLTGMGKDGAAELKLMRDRGAITIAQDRESSVVNGMPGEAVKLGGATHVLPAGQIAEGLVAAVGRGYAKGKGA